MGWARQQLMREVLMGRLDHRAATVLLDCFRLSLLLFSSRLTKVHKVVSGVFNIIGGHMKRFGLQRTLVSKELICVLYLVPFIITVIQ